MGVLPCPSASGVEEEGGSNLAVKSQGSGRSKNFFNSAYFGIAWFQFLVEMTMRDLAISKSVNQILD